MPEVKTKTNKKQQEPEFSVRSATLDASTFNVDDNSIEVVFATDTPVLTRDWDTGELFYEVLSMNPADVVTERLDSGLPVLDNHDRYGSVKDQLGTSRAYVIDKTKREARATLHLSRRDELKSFCGDVKEGIIKNISGGYKVIKYRDISGKDDKIRTLEATWMPIEISFTQVQADYKAKVRAAQLLGSPIAMPSVENTNKNNLNENNIRSMGAEGTTTTTTTPVVTPAPVDPVLDPEKLRSEGAQAEGKRRDEIGISARALSLDAAFVKEHIDKGTSAAEFNSLAVRKLADIQSKENEITPVSNAAVTGDDKERSAATAGINEALTIRAYGVAEVGKDGPKTELGKSVANGRRISIVEGARSLMAPLIGRSAYQISDEEIIERAMSSTDYPAALGAIVNKSLKRRYEMVVPEWRQFATEDADFVDFKPRTTIEVDGDFEAKAITEEGEYEYATFKEGKDSWGIGTFGRKIKLTRRMMINDDLRAFTQYAPIFAQGILDMEAKIMYGLLTGNDGAGRTLGDGNPLFSSALGNLAAQGGVLSEATLSAARLALRSTKSLAGHTLSFAPKYIWIPSELETQADKILTAIIVATKSTDTNVFRGKLEAIVDPYLSQYSGTRWYMTGDPSQVEMLKYASLQGSKGIYTSQRFNWETDSLEVKVRRDFGGTIEDRRGLYANPGA